MADAKSIGMKIEVSYANQMMEEGGYSESITALMSPRRAIMRSLTPKSRALFVAAEKAKDTSIRGILYTIQKNNSLTENYKAQTEIKNLTSVWGVAKGVASSALSGAQAGGVFGPWGAAIGAGVGLAFYGVNAIITRDQTMSSIYQALNSTNAQTTWNAARAGLFDNGRGTEN